MKLPRQDGEDEPMVTDAALSWNWRFPETVAPQTWFVPEAAGTAWASRLPLIEVDAPIEKVPPCEIAARVNERAWPERTEPAIGGRINS